MLWNTAWDKVRSKDTPKVTTDIWSNFQTWLESKPSNEPYDYNMPRSCLIAQYLKEQGKTGIIVGHRYVSYNGGGTQNIPERIRMVAQYPNLEGGRTFGGALAYLKEVWY